MSVSIQKLRTEYKSLCRELGTEGVLNTVPQAFGAPQVEIIGDNYHYVVCERGSEYERKTTTDKQELLYWLISDVVSEMAGDFELKHRIKGCVFAGRCLHATELCRQVAPALESKAPGHLAACHYAPKGAVAA